MARRTVRFSDALVRDRDRTFNRLINLKTGVVQMWEQLTPADIQRVKHRMAALRGATLKRHAEELKALDADQDEITIFEQLVSAFATKHLSSAESSSLSSEPVSATEEEPTVAVVIDNHSSEPPALEEMRQDAPSPLQVIHQRPSPNFAIPPRLLRRFGP